MPTIDELKAEKATVRKKLTPLNRRISELTSEKYGLESKINSIDEKIAKIHAETMPESEIADRLNDGQDKGGMEEYRKTKHFFKNMGLEVSGYFPKTGQKTLGFSICSTCNDEQLEELKDNICKVLPFLIPMETNVEGIEEDTIYLNVTDEDLSESGIIHARINVEEGIIYWCKTVYGRTYLHEKFDDLMTFLRFIRDNHHYNYGFGYDWEKDKD